MGSRSLARVTLSPSRAQTGMAVTRSVFRRSEKVRNCATMSPDLVDSELFGHELGAFAGAVRQRVGRIEFANRGTLFLDEVETMPPDIQVKLLRFLAEREVTPLGSNEVRSVDVRIVTAAKSNLAESGHPAIRSDRRRPSR